jgi:MFS family permease
MNQIDYSTEENPIDDFALPRSVDPHPKALVHFSIARFFERLAFYSMRHWLIIYLLVQARESGDTAAHYNAYHWAVGAVVLAMLPGGLFVDLLYSRRKAVVWGGVLLAVGYFVLAIDHPLATLLAFVCCFAGMGLYGPGSLSALGGFYTGRQVYLEAGMYHYQGWINAAAFLGSIFIGFASMHLSWQQGCMLAGIAMMAGHVHLLAIARVFLEPKLPKIHADDQADQASMPGQKSAESVKGPWLLIFSILGFGFFGFAMQLGHHHLSEYDWSADWGKLLGIAMTLLGMLAAFAGSALFTRNPINARILLGYGLLSAVLAGLIFPGVIHFLIDTVEHPVDLMLTIFALLAVLLSEFLVLPALNAMILRQGKRFTNTLLGLAAVLAYLPYFAIFFPTAVNVGNAGGLAFVVAAVVTMTLCGWYLLKSGRKERPASSVVGEEAHGLRAREN